MHIFIGLDISTSCTGICIINTRKKQVFTKGAYKLRRKSDPFDRYLHSADMYQGIHEFIHEHVSPKDAGGICLNVEFYSPGANKSAGDRVPFLQGYIHGRIEAQSFIPIPQEYINQSNWKYNLIGQSTMGKELVEESFREVCQKNGWALKIDGDIVDDMFDACGIAYWGLCKESQTIRVQPHSQYLKKIERFKKKKKRDDGLF